MNVQEEREFRRFLEGIVLPNGRQLTENGIQCRITNSHACERLLGYSFETAVASDVAMCRALLRVHDSGEDRNGRLSNPLRKYYEMRTGRLFPRLADARILLGN